MHLHVASMTAKLVPKSLPEYSPGGYCSRSYLSHSTVLFVYLRKWSSSYDEAQLLITLQFLPPFPPQQAKVRKKLAHLQIPRRHVWKRNTHQHAGQVWCVAGACLGVTIERGALASPGRAGDRWRLPRVAMLLQ